MGIQKNISLFQSRLSGTGCTLLVVSKNQPPESIQEAYDAGHRIFGENRVQEMVAKWNVLPRDIAWHMIGHLQTNKVKYIAPFVSLIHSVDSVKLFHEIHKQGKRLNRVIPCLLQVRIAQEESKFGMSQKEVLDILEGSSIYPYAQVNGLMGMATLTGDEDQVRSEFRLLKQFYTSLKEKKWDKNIMLNELSMGMSSDYAMALEMGSTMVRIGTAIFVPQE